MKSEYIAISLEIIAEFLNDLFSVERFPLNERGGIYLASSRPIKRIGLALKPGEKFQEWMTAESVDALFLHRPWKLEIEHIKDNMGVISYHLPFDEYLTIGFNIRLAQVLNISKLEILGEKENRPIGMLGEISSQSFGNLCDRISKIFGGYEKVSQPINTEITRIAVVGAMTDLLVREAAARGADVYITGQLRQPAAEALRETKIGALAVGHYRSEVWGLRALARILQERWPSLEVVIK
ncbi:Nif3-like dinuclear metal center hexameric protein [Nostoc sp. FACHB-152]|uniref:Nif3-like dinuclear metal center hexameric protein n=1 Tax=unclassified Nostoc TaxID=2593658 RepID=UPI001682064D|nr:MULTISPECIES: Nif3-like dinuclear metal center hexameric protein [unclassified Nostoc]MBD2445607.1 Nif3-like dinuclear metal center hexameric protein [Nostoc sp. FACHB-152]MBD2466720.1 Nif3-like dinuclear metal center hexameric protein [Nostoc sp. FACHB-145]